MGVGQRPQNSIMKEGFSERFRSLLGDMPMTDLAIRLGNIVSAKSLWTYKNGRDIPSPTTLVEIARYYNVSVDWLLTGSESKTMPFSEGAVAVARAFTAAEELVPWAKKQLLGMVLRQIELTKQTLAMAAGDNNLTSDARK